MIKGNYDTNVIITHLKSVCKSEKGYFFFGYKDDQDNYRSHSYYTPAEFDQIDPIYNLICLNSFHVNPFYVRRTEKFLTTLYAIHIDLDGWNENTPLSHIDILESWYDLGFDKDPSIVIRTSEGRFHIIVWLKPIAAFPDKKSYWKKCQKGLCTAFHEFGADSQPPVNFIRRPGSINYKYIYKPIVEIVHSSESIFTLSDIHQILIDNEVFHTKPQRVKTSLLEGITEIEKGVRHGVTNYALYTLALHYRDKGLSIDKAIQLLTQWNKRNELPEVHNKFINTINSAYGSTNIPSQHWINNILNRNKEPEINPVPIRNNPTPKINKSDLYRDKIIVHLKENNGTIKSSLRSLSASLNIPWKSFRRAIDNERFDVEKQSIGRNSRAIISLKQNDNKHLKLVHSSIDKNQNKMGQINGSKPGVYTEGGEVREHEEKNQSKYMKNI